MPLREVYKKLLKAGIRVDKCHHCNNDSLETEKDLSLLFKPLISVKDKFDKPFYLALLPLIFYTIVAYRQAAETINLSLFMPLPFLLESIPVSELF